MNTLDGLKTEFQNSGLMVDSPNLNGKIQRVNTTDKPKGKTGWYIGWIKLINGILFVAQSVTGQKAMMH